MQKTLIAFALISTISFTAQTFTWKRGSNAGGPAGSYGTMGQSSPTNDPGGRHGSATWTDKAGNLWLFGGEGYDGTTTLGWLNDLWKYDITTNQWTWIRGSNALNSGGASGVIGAPASTNDPGAREFPQFWTDTLGNFWMFGGLGYQNNNSFGSLSDLWKYGPVTNQWTWMKGPNTPNQFGIYGTVSTPNISNAPGARLGGACWSENNQLWMYGGRGYGASGPANFLNDLWKYDIASNTWTWMKGPNTSGQPGSFGTIMVAASTNNPGGKEFPATWKDAAGKLYLFGGRGAGYFNDLWKYDPVSNNWTWINGANTPNQIGNYGTINVPSSSNVPGGRYATASWTDKAGDFLLFGGTGWSATNLNTLNDLWRYDPCQNVWTWLKGTDTTNQTGVYGTVNVPSPLNVPGSRMYNNYFNNNTNQLWLFGGEGFGSTNAPVNHLNDVWLLEIPPASDSLISSGLKICSGSNASLTLSGSTNTVSWYAGNSIVAVGMGSVYTTPTLSAISGPSLYTYSAIKCPAQPKSSITITVNILPTLTMLPVQQVVCGNYDNSFVVTGANTYTWNGSTVSPTLFVPKGTYAGQTTITVSGSDQNGCFNSLSKVYSFIPCSGIGENDQSLKYNLFPNPASGEINIFFDLEENIELSIINSIGTTVWNQQLSSRTNRLKIDLIPGIYIFKLSGKDKNASGKLIIN